MTPTMRAEKLRADFSELIRELHDGQEYRQIMSSLNQMHEEEVGSDQVQRELTDMMNQAVQCLSRAADMARV